MSTDDIQLVEMQHITRDPRFQVRNQLDSKLVKQYAVAMSNGAEFPPIHLAQVGEALFIVDGWHRQAAQHSLTTAWPVNVGPLNPHLYIPNQMFAQSMVYEPLVKYQADGSVQPWLATRWRHSADGKTWWFTLRDRSDMIYPVLLGRRLLAELGPVDSARTFTVQPSCR